MSIISSSLLLFLLCLSFHACNARRLAAIGKEPVKKFLLPNKNDEKGSPVRPSVVPKFKPTLSNELGAVEGDRMSKVKQIRVGKDNRKPIIISKGKDLKDQGAKISGAVKSTQESLLSVSSWRVPHRNRGEQQPGFNLDYSPPKTHPPVHN